MTLPESNPESGASPDPAGKFIEGELVANRHLIEEVIVAMYGALRKELGDKMSVTELRQVMFATAVAARERAHSFVVSYYRPAPETLLERRTALRKAHRVLEREAGR
jgi:hypothetical protein